MNEAPTEYIRVICPNCGTEIAVKHAGPGSQMAICHVCESLYNILIMIIPINVKELSLN